MRKIYILILMALFASTAYAKKERVWQVGKLVEFAVERKEVSPVSHRNFYVYTIELGEYLYVAEERPGWTDLKHVDLTINAPVKVIVERTKVHILTEDGKEHEAEIQKRILKTPH